MTSTALEKSLDEIIGNRPMNERRGAGRSNRGGRRDTRRTPYARDARDIRPSRGDEDRGSPDHGRDRWSHDRYDGARSKTRPDYDRRGRDNRSTCLRVTNIHYDLSEEDVRNLFERVAPVIRFNMRYDRAGRSEGMASVTYDKFADAKAAVVQFDGQRALGQVLQVEIDPQAPSSNNGTSLASRIGRVPTGSDDNSSQRQRRGGRDQGRGEKKQSTRRGPVTVDDLDAELDNYINERNSGGTQQTAAPEPSTDGVADGMQID